MPGAADSSYDAVLVATVKLPEGLLEEGSRMAASSRSNGLPSGSAMEPEGAQVQTEA